VENPVKSPYAPYPAETFGSEPLTHSAIPEGSMGRTAKIEEERKRSPPEYWRASDLWTLERTQVSVKEKLSTKRVGGKRLLQFNNQ